MVLTETNKTIQRSSGKIKFHFKKVRGYKAERAFRSFNSSIIGVGNVENYKVLLVKGRPRQKLGQNLIVVLQQ